MADNDNGSRNNGDLVPIYVFSFTLSVVLAIGFILGFGFGIFLALNS